MRRSGKVMSQMRKKHANCIYWLLSMPVAAPPRRAKSPARKSSPGLTVQSAAQAPAQAREAEEAEGAEEAAPLLSPALSPGSMR